LAAASEACDKIGQQAVRDRLGVDTEATRRDCGAQARDPRVDCASALMRGGDRAAAAAGSFGARKSHRVGGLMLRSGRSAMVTCMSTACGSRTLGIHA
jgi:hypothetical protein